MRRDTHIGLGVSAILHVTAIVALGGIASQPWLSPLVAVNRGVITLEASWTAVDPSESTAEFHVHAPGMEHDHEHPMTPFAAHSHPVRKTTTQSTRWPRDVDNKLDVDVVPSLSGSVPIRANPPRIEEVTADSESVVSSSQRMPRLPSRVTPVNVRVETVTAPPMMEATPGANVDQMPVRNANNPAPPYPTQAYAERRQGRVVLEVRLDEAGRVKSLRVAESSGYAPFDDSALATVQYWLFTPARSAGRAVPCTIRVPVRFAIRAE
ncbi:MAG: energy transducer TonB [Pirellulales bacterium]